MLFVFAQSAAGETMNASWYSSGTRTASGAPFNPNNPKIAAHPTLPFGTRLFIVNPKNGRHITAVVKDRGPYIKGRSLDLTRAAAALLGYLDQGTAYLSVTVLGR